ncbi:TetR/AcrR family transcriptional regulator [Rhodococcus sp. KRD162]|uniref:TetR/AcrR family transcriptional regulator n=1 Tax=Rhodococcus sp. KRD162 TaxID=2729725 RepID=UPI0019D025BF|nr:TetR/AcrR family transcriptional regulator [Rhodococcus sp. KRD162]
MVQVIGRVNPEDGRHSTPCKKIDARTERWREHRLRVRQELVAAALIAIDEYGPNVSMGDIAKAAGTAKPKLYRHFVDRSDLHTAIVQNVQDMLWDRIMNTVNLFEDSVTDLIDHSVAGYAAIVTDHPNLFRFLVHGHFLARTTDRRTSAGVAGDPALDSARAASDAVARVLSDAIQGPAVDSSTVEIVSYSTFGAVASATDWWLGSSEDRESAMTTEAFTAHLAAIVHGLVESACARAGVRLESDQPMHRAFVPTEGSENQ